MSETSITDSFRIQARGCESLGSPLYARLMSGLAECYEKPLGAPIRSMIGERFPRPVHDAVPLRLAGAVHRIVLRGDAPDLARFYPSAGGSVPGDCVEPFCAVVERFATEISEALDTQVQTNEVGRSALLAAGFSHIARRTGRALDLYELGASAGLNLRWDRYRHIARGAIGDPASPLVFDEVWTSPPLLTPVEVVERRGCDIAPLDASDTAAQDRLLSFVWPDQRARFARLRAALDIAASTPVPIDQADAGEWLAERLPHRRPGATAVVYHSIVWQYLPAGTKDRVRAALDDAAATATAESPLAWLRMEPAGPVADLRLTMWPGGDEQILATASYHGASIDWSSAD